MRWSLGRMFALMTAVAITLFLYSQFWHNVLAKIMLSNGIWIGVVIVSAVASVYASPTWKRFLLTIALFNLCFLVLMLCLYIKEWNAYAPMCLELSLLMSLICALLTLGLPDPIEPLKVDDHIQPEIKS